MAFVSDPYTTDSQHCDSQRYNEYAFEATQQATQLTQPGTQGTYLANSQVEPRRKYCELGCRSYTDGQGLYSFPSTVCMRS